MSYRRLVLLGSLIAAPHWGYADEGLLHDGLYEVAVTYDMGATEDLTARQTTRVCLMAGDANGVHGLTVLTKSQPVAACPIKNVGQQGEVLTFDIVCEGTDAGRASAVFSLEQQAFEGRIAIRMGGKNMTMREAQSGRRVGDCDG